jgi:hypothetical protein
MISFGVLFIGENDGPYFYVCDNVHLEYEFGFTKIRRAEMFPNKPLRRFNPHE